MIIQDYPSYLNSPGFYFNATLNAATNLVYRCSPGIRIYTASAHICFYVSPAQASRFLRGVASDAGERFKISSGLARARALIRPRGTATTCFLDSKTSTCTRNIYILFIRMYRYYNYMYTRIRSARVLYRCSITSKSNYRY